MNLLSAIFAFLPLTAMAAVDFPTGRFVCSRTSSGPARSTLTYDISKVIVGTAAVPYLEYTADTVDANGHAMPTVKVAGLGTVTTGSGITTIRLDHLGISFTATGEPELAYCKKAVAP